MIFRGRALSSATHLASNINWPTATPALSKLQATRVRESPPLMYLAVFLTEQESPPDYEIGLVIGATETPSIGKTAGGAIDLNSSLALGAEYDRRLLGEPTTLYVALDFLASPADVKVSYLTFTGGLLIRFYESLSATKSPSYAEPVARQGKCTLVVNAS